MPTTMTPEEIDSVLCHAKNGNIDDLASEIDQLAAKLRRTRGQTLLSVIDGEGRGVIHVAAQHGRTNVIDFIGRGPFLAIEPGWRLSAMRWTCGNGDNAIQWAARFGRSDAILELFLCGQQDLNHINHRLESALHIATRNANEDIMHTLLQLGAWPDVRNKRGETPLFLAAALGFYGIARMLLEHGANPNLWVRYRITPLHVAARNRRASVVGLLLDRGANPNIRSVHGWSPAAVPLHLIAQGFDTLGVLYAFTRRGHLGRLRRRFRNST